MLTRWGTTRSIGLRWVAHVFLCLALLGAGLARVQAAESTELSRGLAWLRAQIQADGAVAGEAGSIATSTQVRGEALLTLAQLATTPTSLLENVFSSSEMTTEAQARAAIALMRAGQVPSAFITNLRARQNADGGFGDTAGAPSNPLDTAWTLLAFRVAGFSDATSLQSGLNYLISTIRADGGVAAPGSDSSVYTTTYALQTLVAYRDAYALSPYISKAINWLNNARGGNLGYGETLYNALATVSLAAATTDSTQYANLIAALKAVQAEDGSWQHDPYLTSIVLRALAGKAQPPSSAQGGVSGLVIDGSSRAPLAGATISIAGFSVSSDDVGRFDTTGIDPGSYPLTVTKAGYGSAQLQVTVATGVTDAGAIALAVMPESALIRGVVVDGASGQPLAGVSILVSVGTTDLSSVSASNGTFEIGGIPAASGSISVQKTGYRSVSTTLQFASGTSYNFSPTLYAEGEPAPTTATLSGRVIAADSGMAIAGARVIVSSKSVTTAADGSFLVGSLNPGATQFTVEASGYGTAALSGVLSAGLNRVGDLRLQPLASQGRVRGQVIDSATLAPLSDATVSLAGLKVNSDQNGRFETGGIGPGTYGLTVAKAGYAPAQAQVTVSAGVIADMGSVRLAVMSTTAVVRGVVIDGGNGQPLAGATITIGAGNSVFSTLSAATGGFELSGIPPTNGSIAAEKQGYRSVSAAVQFAAGASYNFSPTLYAEDAPAPTNATVTGRVIANDTGNPVSGAHISVGAKTISSAADGSFTLEQLEPGTVTIAIQASGYNAASFSGLLSAGSNRVGDLRLQPAATTLTLFGEVTNAAGGSPVAGALVREQGTGRYAVTNSRGSYRLEGLTENHLNLVIEANGYYGRTLAVNASGFGDLEVDIPLSRAEDKGIKLSVASNLPSYDPFSDVQITATVSNELSQDRLVVLTATVYDRERRVVEVIPFKELVLGSRPADATYTVPAGRSVDLGTKWYNQSTPAGDYSIVVSAAELTGELLAEASVGVPVNPKTAIGGGITVNPPITQAGTSEPVSISALVGNRGNLDYPGGPARLSIVLDTPDPSAPATTPASVEEVHAGAPLNKPRGAATDAAGNLYTVDSGSLGVLKIAPSGNVQVLATMPTAPVDLALLPDGSLRVLTSNGSIYRVDNSGLANPATPSGIANANSLASDAAGNLYVAGMNSPNEVLNRIGADGQQTELLRNGLGRPMGVATGADGKLYITNSLDGSISRVDATGRIEPFLSKGLNAPMGLLLEPAGSFLVADSGSNRVLRVQADRTVSVFATGIASPRYLAYGSAGEVFVTSAWNSAVYRISPSGQVTPFGQSVGSSPTAVAYSNAGELYISGNDGTLRRLNAAGVIETVLASGKLGGGVTDMQFGSDAALYALSGGGVTRYQPDSGVITTQASGLTGASGLAMDGAGNLLVAESAGNRITRIGQDGTKEVVAQPLLQNPLGVAVARDGTRYILNTVSLTRIPASGRGHILVPNLGVSGTDIALNPAGGVYLLLGMTRLMAVSEAGVMTLRATVPASLRLTVALDGTVYLLDQSATKIHRLRADNTLQTFATTSYRISDIDATPSGGLVGALVDGFLYRFAEDGSATKFVSTGSIPSALSAAADGAIDMLFGHGEYVRVSPAGQKTVVVSGLNSPVSFARGAAGDFDILEASGSALLKQFSSDNRLLRTVAGFGMPSDVEWVDGEIVFCDGSYGRVYKVSPTDGIARLFAGIRLNRLHRANGALYGTVNGAGRVVQVSPDGSVTDYYTNSSLTSLQGIAASGGEVAVTSSNTQRVLVLAPDRTIKASYTSLVTPTGIAVDSSGRPHVASREGVVRYTSDGLQSELLPLSLPASVAFAPDGQLWAASGHNVLRFDGTQFIAVANAGSQVTSLAFSGERLFVTDEATLRRLSGSALPIFAAGISKVRALRIGPDGALYMASESGIVTRYAAGAVQVIAANLPALHALSFAADELFVGGRSDIYRIDIATGASSGQGPGKLLDGADLRGLAADPQNRLLAVATSVARLGVYRIGPTRPTSIPEAGTEVYSVPAVLGPIAVNGSPQLVELGSWVPPYAGDYSFHLLPSDGTAGGLVNNLHVGPYAGGTMTADRSSVSPGDAALKINVAISGADFTSLSKADPSNLRDLIASVRPSVMGTDPLGNLYFADSKKIVRVKPDGTSANFYVPSGFTLTPYGSLPIDPHSNLYTANSLNQVLRIRPDATAEVMATLPAPVAGMVIDSHNDLIVALPGAGHGTLYKIRQDGSFVRLDSLHDTGFYAITIDGADNVYLFSHNNNTITKLSPGGVFSIALAGDVAKFEREGMPIAGDCADNLLVAPYSWPEMHQSPQGPNGPLEEEHTLVQISGRTGQAAKLFDGFSVNPRLDDIDYIVYDRFGQALLMWTDFRSRISRMPISCGAISTDLHVVTPAGQAVATSNTAPAMVVSNPDGSHEYVWNLKDVTARGRNVQFDTTLPGMKLGEERTVATEAYLLFRNSFTGGTIKLPLEIPEVNAAGLVAMSLSTDQSSYPANTDVIIDLALANPNGIGVQGRVRVDLLDANGALVKTVLDEDQTIDANAPLVLHPPLSTGTYYAGSYSLKASFTDASGYLQAQASTQFSITASGADPGGQASVKVTPTTDKPVYGEFDAVQIQGRIRSDAANYIYEDLTLILTVVDPNGTQVLSQSRSIRQLMPGAMVDARTTYKLPGNQLGTFGLHAAIVDRSGSVIAAGTTSLEARADDAAKMTGSVVAARKVVPLTESQTCRDTITNGGDRSLMGLPIRQSIIELASDRVVSTATREYDVSAHGQQTLTRMFSTDAYALAPHACVLEAQVAGKWKTLGYDTFTVDPPPIRVTASMERGPRGRLLVLMDGAPVTGSSKAEPAPEQQRSFLERVLTREGWSYTIVTDPDAFTWELRSGAYNVFALFSESAKLPERVQMELREAVYRGEGLLEAGAHDQRHQNFDDALGVKYQGKAAGVTGIEVQATEPGPAGYADLNLRDKPLRAQLNAASSLGRYTGGKTSDRSAVGTRSYGRGKSVYLGYDLLAEATLAGDGSLHTQLLLRSLAYVQPVYSQSPAGRVIPLRISLHNEGNATPGELVLPMPSGASIVDRGTATVRDGALVWSFNLAVNEEKTFTAWVRLPDSGGRVTFTAQVLVGPPANRVAHSTAALTLDPVATGGLADARRLAASSADFKQVQLWLDKADAALRANDAETALAHLAKASDELLKVTHASSAELRLLIDQALLDAGRRYWGG